MHLRDLTDVGLIDETWLNRFDGELQSRLELVLQSPEG